ncbi:ABC transporter substrate-binding protein [Chachezhania antarctica]|uniref:ABC transporter substrate-binding protein n=1 Tax=Chachezhania antarctica TaxID=2340860 RepID=UPI000EB50AC1|nr:ABC transporter substrate-binding protein [Chachezhania antarctica]|tara:strand:+ start:3189 stop:4817 length:1629 start_codon:yes stop_codon:yes gene_type:complete
MNDFAAARGSRGVRASNQLRLVPFALAAALAAAPLAALADGTVTLGRTADADRYDPHRSSALAAAEVLQMIGDTLVTLSPDQKTVLPELAESWEMSEDGLTYTFHLKEGVTFCDGKPFTAADVVGTMDRWLAPDAPNVSTWRAGEVDEITAQDDLTVVYKLKVPSSNLLYQMANFNFIMIDPDQAEALGDNFGVTAFNGTGPFCLESWSPRDQVVLKRHDGYTWGAPELGNPGPAKVDTVIWKIIPEEATLVATIPAGEIDASYSVPSWALAQFEADPTVQLLRPEASFRTHYIGMKTSRPAMDDIKVRQAIAHAIDQDAMAEGLWFGVVNPTVSYFSDKVLDYPADTDTSAFTFDPGKTAELLTDAGYEKAADGFWQKDGTPLTLTYYGFNETLSRGMAEAVQGDLRKVGIQVDVENYDSTAIWGKLREDTYDLYEMSYPYLSAGDALNLYFHSGSIPSPNRMMWNDPETDKLMEAGNAAITPEARAAAFEALTRHVHEAVLWKPLVEETPVVAAGPRLEAFEPAGMSGAVFDSGLNLSLK